MHLLFVRVNNLNLPIDLQLKLFDNTVLPILTYACEVWGYEDNKKGSHTLTDINLNGVQITKTV